MQKQLLYILLLFIFTYPDNLNAAPDTLSVYHSANNPGSISTAYELKIARFDLPAPAYIKGFKVLFGGSAGEAKLHLFGHEAGTSFPQLENDLVQPITIKKENSGVQWLHIELNEPVYLNNAQFFIGFSGFTSNLFPMMDRFNHPPSCMSESGGNYRYLFAKRSDGSWTGSNSAFIIKVILEYPDKTPQNYLVNHTEESGLPTDMNLNTAAIADFNKSQFNDILINGRLFRNNGDAQFTEITEEAGLSGSASANIFIDINNNGWLDILVLRRNQATAYLNQGDETFEAVVFDTFPELPNISGLTAADYNLNGYPDFYIAQLWSPYPDALPDYFFVNNGDTTFTDRTELINPPENQSRGASWVDYNNNGYMDLYVSNYFLQGNELYENQGDGTFNEVAGQRGVRGSASGGSPQYPAHHTTGVDWADYNNSGSMDLFLPQLAHPRFTVQHGHQMSTVLENNGAPGFSFTDRETETGIEFEETHFGGAWGDVNNNGLKDLFIPTVYGCRYSTMYVQNPDNTFTNETYHAGTHRLEEGREAVWADLTGNGRLDLITGDNRRTALFINKDRSRNNYIAFELESTTANSHAIGARVYVYSDGQMYMDQVRVGQGLKMQKPYRLHFGLADRSNIDLVVVYWPDQNKTRETFSGFEVNNFYYLKQGGEIIAGNNPSVKNTHETLRVYPNPASNQITIEMPYQADTYRIYLYDLAGQSIINELTQEKTFLIETVELQPGTYILKVASEKKLFHEKIVIRH